MRPSDAKRELVDYLKRPGFIAAVTREAANRSRVDPAVVADLPSISHSARRRVCATVALNTVEAICDAISKENAPGRIA